MLRSPTHTNCLSVALYARAWVEISAIALTSSASLVALYARAWVEISSIFVRSETMAVALYARAWVEIYLLAGINAVDRQVALYARAWVEIASRQVPLARSKSPSTRGRG